MAVSPASRLLANTVAASPLLSPRLRNLLLRRCGVAIDPSALVRAGCYFDGAAEVAIGAESFVNVRCHFDARAAIRIGERCDIGMEVMFCGSDHAIGRPQRRAGTPTGAAITIGDGTWIGARATILPGVTVAPGCIIAAGAVVTRDTAPDGLYGGVPARRLRDLAGEAPARADHVDGPAPPREA